jgi:hypothetical protein
VVKPHEESDEKYDPAHVQDFHFSSKREQIQFGVVVHGVCSK